MRSFVVALAGAAAACTFAPDRGESAPASTPATGPEFAVPAEPVRSYATQLTAPSPDYAAMLRAAPARPAMGETRRPATARAPGDAKAVGDAWVARLKARGVLGGYGLGGKREDDPVSMIQVLMTAREFDAWVAANGWTQSPHIDWNFAGEVDFPAITPAAQARVRVWPVATVRSGAQNQALLGGRITLEDGCFFLDRKDGDGYQPQGRHLVQFSAETGLIVDPQGYLALISRYDGSVLARLGEDMFWAGPNWLATGPEAAAITAACGDYPVEYVGTVDAAERFYARYPHTRPR